MFTPRKVTRAQTAERASLRDLLPGGALAVGALAWTVVLALAVCSFVFSDQVLDWVMRHEALSLVGLAVPAALGGLVWWHSGKATTPAELPWRWVAPLAVLFALGLFIVDAGFHERDHGLIEQYCKYGAVSQAQVDGCIDPRQLDLARVPEPLPMPN